MDGTTLRKVEDTDGEVLGHISCGSVIEGLEFRLVEHCPGDLAFIYVNYEDNSGWVIETDLVPCSRLMGPDLHAEMSRKALIRSSRKLGNSSGQKTELCQQRCEGRISLDAQNLFLLNNVGRDDLAVSSDMMSVTMESESMRALVLGSRGFARGVHYWLNDIYVSYLLFGLIFYHGIFL